MKVKFCVAAR